MRTALLFILTATLIARAEDITTINGKKYEHATITRTEPDGIVVLHSTGVSKIPFDELNDDLRARYPYDRVAAKRFAAETVAKQQVIYQQATNARAKDTQAISTRNSDDEKALRETAARKAIRGFALEANEAGTSSANYTTWETSYGSEDRHWEQNKRIVISAHDLGGNTATCTLSVYYVALSLTENLHKVFAKESADVFVDKGIEARTSILSPTLKSSRLNLVALGESWVNGATIEGWIATGTIEGLRFGLKASNQTVGKDAEALIAEYEARQGKRKPSR